MLSRSQFLRSAALLAASPLVVPSRDWFIGNALIDPDADICAKIFRVGISKKWSTLPLGDVIVEVGKTFLGIEYVGHTLEQKGEERLVVNLRGFDCVSFYENCLVFARCIKKGTTTFDDYKRELQFIRYRGGTIDGYPSRLHYTSDYFFDNVKKKVWRNVTEEIGGKPFSKTINFMSTHPDSYQQLKENPSFLAVVKEQEAEIMKRTMFFVPKNRVADVAPKIHNGDIIGITTTIEGMDVGHTGVALWVDGTLRFMHAPIAGSKVQITDVPLAEYLLKIKKHSGIMVVRPIEG
jgi:hypothetical protein